MAAKFLLCAVLAIFAVQALNANPASKNGLEDIIHEWLLKIKEALHNLTLKLEALGNAAAEKIHAVAEAIKAKGKELLDKALQQIDVIEAAVRAKIEELIKLAADNGVDISECIAVAKPALEALKLKTHEDLKNCVAEQVKQAEAIAQNVVALVKLGVAEAKQAELNVEQCLLLEKPLDVIDCLKQEATKASQEALRLAGLVGEEVKKAEKLAVQAATEVPACIAHVLDEARKAAEVIVQEFKRCVDDKINNKP